ncbi:MAG: 30S ribosomal protein S7 [bacterium JZ-2024 1]
MPRKGAVPKRPIPPDPKFQNPIINRLINKVMRDGKKSIAQRLVYTAFDIVAARTKGDPIKVFEAALRNVIPELIVRSRRVGGANYQIPTEVPYERGLQLGLRWLVDAARSRKAKGFELALAQEIMDAASGAGNAVKKKIDTHKMAEANRAFAHYRW